MASIRCSRTFRNRSGYLGDEVADEDDEDEDRKRSERERELRVEVQLLLVLLPLG